MAGGVGSTNRVALTTIEEWNKQVSELTLRRLILLAIMRKKGRIKTGCSGPQFRWVVRIKEHQLQGFPDAQPVKFARKTTKENAFLPNRGYYLSDTITLREKLEQGGPEAMIKIFANREEVMREAAIRGLAAEIFVDGNSAANVAREAFHGVESFMGIAAQTASDIIATTHDDSYAGLSTAVNGLTSDSEGARAWTPAIINTDHTPTGGSQQTWADYADEYVRELLLRTSYGQSADQHTDLIMLTRDSYKDLLNLLDDKERIPVARGSSLALTKLGFGDHVELDGCPITWDESVPTTDADSATVNGYSFTTSQMQLRVLGSAKAKSLFSTKVTFNDTYRADNIFMHLLGNLCFKSPKYFGKLAAISSVAS